MKQRPRPTSLLHTLCCLVAFAALYGISPVATAADGTGLLRYGPTLSGAPQSVPTTSTPGLAILGGILTLAGWLSRRHGTTHHHEAILIGLSLGAAGLWLPSTALIPAAIATTQPSWTELTDPSGGEVLVPPGYMEYKNTSGVDQHIIEIRQPECPPDPTSHSAGLFKHPQCVAGDTLLQKEEICYTLYRCVTEPPTTDPPRLGNFLAVPGGMARCG